MAIKKLSGGVEDLTFGMGTIEQLRKGVPYTITQLNASYIPYSSTQTVTAKIDQVESVSDSARIGLNNHLADESDPHNVTAEQTGAEPYLGLPVTNGEVLVSFPDGRRIWVKPVDGGTAEWGEILGDIKAQADLQNELDAKLNLAGGRMTGGLVIDSDIGQLTLMNDYSNNLYFVKSTGVYTGIISAYNGLTISSVDGPLRLVSDANILTFNGDTIYHEGNLPGIDYKQGNIGASYIPDLDGVSIMFLTVTEANGVIENPTSLQAGQIGSIVVGQGGTPFDGTTFGDKYLFGDSETPVLPNVTHAQLKISYIVKSGFLFCTVESTYGTVVGDTTKPVITMIGDDVYNVLVDSLYTDEGAIALDDVDGDITSSIVTVNPVDTSIEGVYNVTYNVSDTSGNAADEVTRVVTVVASPPPLYEMTEPLVIV